MISAKEPSNERERVAALYQCNILDTETEQGFDDITQLAAYICQTSMAFVSLVDKDRQWFKSKVGINDKQMPRNIAFCAHAILEDRVFIVRDALQDVRFVDNPLVVNPPNIRFYAGVPLKTAEGYNLGTLCVADHHPHDLSPEQIASLKTLAGQVEYLIETRRSLQIASRLIAMKVSSPPQQTFLKKLVFGAVLAISMITGMGAIAYSSLNNLRQTNSIFITQRQGFDLINRSVNHLRDLRVAMMNYLVVDSQDNLDRYNSSYKILSQNLQEIERISSIPVSEKLGEDLRVGDRYVQTINLLTQRIRQELISSSQTINLHKTAGIEASRQQIINRSRNGDNLLIPEDLELEKLLTIENNNLIKWLQNRQVSITKTINTSLVILLFVLSILGVLFYLINREANVRHQLVKTLEQERDLTVAVLDTVGALVIVLDPEGKIVRFNRECERVTGYRHEEISNQVFWNIFLSNDDQTSVRAAIAKLSKHNTPISHENYWMTKNGDRRLISWSTTSLLGHNDQVDFIIATGLDITDRRLVEEEVQLQSWRNVLLSQITLRIRQSLDISEILETTVHEVRKFLKADRVLIYQFDDIWQGTVVVESVQEPWHKTMGEDVQDHCFSDGLWEEYRQGKHITHDDIVNSDMPECYKKMMARFQVRANLTIPLLENDRLWGLLIAHQCGDIRHWRNFEVNFLTELGYQVGIALYQANLLEQETQRRQQLSQQNTELEEARHEAEAATKMKSAFLATMSHEIRTPMNAVLGMTGLLADTVLSDLQRDFVETVRISGENLLTLINEILDFSKLEANEMELEEVNFDLNNCVEEVTDLLAMLAYSKGLELAALVHQNVPLYLTGDVSRLRQVLTNLVSNAIKFTEKGEVVIRVSLIEEIGSVAKIEFRVIDTGIGIKPESQKKLFQPFTQVDASTTRKYGGTGLGLAICRQIIDLMGGTIGIDSDEGKGSQFWFRVPFVKQSTDAIANLRPRNEVNLNDIRVLVVDDSATNCKILSYQLTAWKMRVTSVQHADQAMLALREAQFQGEPYQLAILDMQMPDIDGEMLGAKIKADPDLKNTKLIMLTSLNQQGGVARVRDLGFEFYLVKPVKQSRLLDTLMEIASTDVNSEFAFYSYQSKSERRLPKPDQPIKKESKLKILLAEDSLINQKVALHQLRSFGYNADLAGNGQEVLELLERIRYDIILMDCQMPEMDGYETTIAIRKLSSNSRKIVIIAMTANAMKEDRDRCIACGMDDYLSKPIRKEDLAHKLQEWEVKILAQAETQQSDIAFTDESQLSVELQNQEDIMQESVPLIDWSYIDDIADGDQEIKHELLQSFVDTIPANLKDLEMAIAAKDCARVAKFAHLIKGSSINLGIVSISEAADHLEKISRDYQLDHAEQLLTKMQNFFSQIQDLTNEISS